MDRNTAFDNLVECLNAEPNTSFFVEAEILKDMGVNFQHLGETVGREIKRRQIIKTGSDGLPMTETEFEFCPKPGRS